MLTMLSKEERKEISKKKNLEIYNQTLNNYHSNRENIAFNFNRIKGLNTSKINLKDLTDQEIKNGIVSLESNVRTHDIDICHAWYNIFNMEIVQRRKEKINKIISNIKDVGR